MARLFGTDGVRGVANTELTCELAMSIGRAAATVLTQGGDRRPTVVIGCDTRISSDMLCAAMTAGLCSVGADVIQLGVVPTPAVAYLVSKYQADAGVMISASHNPPQFNGIKIFGSRGIKLPDSLEQRIEETVLDNMHPLTLANGNATGRVTYSPEGAKYYAEHIRSSVSCRLDGLRIALDCANGAACATVNTVFGELGAELHIIHNDPDGVNINRDCGSTHLQALAKYVVENRLDCGIAFDGDADRCLCVDEKGNEVDGDAILAMCANDMASRGVLRGGAVVGTVMSNLGLSKFCEAQGLRFIATKVGDRYVLEQMLEQGYSLGGEQSGHVIFLDHATTGDGQLTAMHLLELMSRKKQSLSALASVMTRYPQTMINVTVTPEGKAALADNAAINETVAYIRRRLGRSGRILVRVSGTEPLIRVMVEGEDVTLINTLAEQAARVIAEQLS